jgi:DNA-binding PadR family transcriptional regulator
MQPTRRSDELERFLPLRPIEFQILLSLAAGERHGYAIIRDAADRAGAPVRWGLGTLYRALRRLVDQGLIEGTDSRPAPEEDDERRNYYRILPLGRRVVTAEAGRMEAMVGAARSSGVLGPAERAR